jgi:hypothetical protein
MLLPQKSGFGSRPPTAFTMTVSTAAGIRDAGQVIAHEMLHISQVINGRLVLSRKTRKIDRQKMKVELACWMGGKPVIVDQLPWHTRPWEIEACHWQALLVDEFLTLASGNQPFLQLQKPGKQRLALFAANLPAVAAAHGRDKDLAAPILADDAKNGQCANGSGAKGHTVNGHTVKGFDISSYGINGHAGNGYSGNGHAGPESVPNGHTPASEAADLADGMLQITVPGLDTPRALEQGALVAKRQDLQSRGRLRSSA